MFILGKIFSSLAFPPGIFIVFALVAFILYLFKKRKAAFGIVALDVILIYLLSTNAFASFLIAPLENKYPPISETQGAQAIVVLGGGYNDQSPEYGGEAALAPEAEKRAIYGLELAKSFNLPLVYSGGTSFAVTTKGSEAEAAGRLWQSLGVPKARITLEKESLDTKTNASNVATLLKGKRIVLVTSAYHMPRAMLSFQKAGMSAIPAPTYYMAKRSPCMWPDYLPSVWALETSFSALHEYIGLPYYRLIK
jgi:uncharacterized SAM-binding protein YcdF (DUF218 family)